MITIVSLLFICIIPIIPIDCKIITFPYTCAIERLLEVKFENGSNVLSRLRFKLSMFVGRVKSFDGSLCFLIALL